MASALLFSLAEAKEFVIDNTHSNIGFSIKHMMISNVKGNFNTYSADIDYDAEKKVFNKLAAKIEAASIDTGITKRDDHLRSADFFDVEKHVAPEDIVCYISHQQQRELKWFVKNQKMLQALLNNYYKSALYTGE
jgi:hypothetical protein